MLRHRRKLLTETLLLGIAVTFVVIVADALRLLEPLEDWFYDQRALTCQHFAPPPTTQLVHLDIDDRALEVIGAWPWPRSKLAAIFDELALARPKAVATDIIFPEPQDVSYVPGADGKFDRIDHDALLAGSLKRLGCAVVPVALFSTKLPDSLLAVAALNELEGNLELTPAQLAANLQHRGSATARQEPQIASLFFPLRREAVFARIYDLLNHASSRRAPQLPVTQPSDAVRELLRPQSAQIAMSSPLTSIISQQFQRAAAINELQKLTPLKPSGAPELTVARGSFYAPILPFVQSAKATGFVDFFNKGAVRNVPLVAEYDGHLYPQIGFALALRTLDIDPGAVRYGTDRITLPRPGGSDIVIPIHSSDASNPARCLLQIPWFGSRDWATMYDPPHHELSKQHIPILKLWQIGELERKLRVNVREADAALLTVLVFANQDLAKAHEQSSPAADDFQRKLIAIVKAIDHPDVKGFYAQLAAIPAEKQDDDTRKFLAAHQQLTVVLPQSRALLQELTTQRSELFKVIRGNAVLVGWTATGLAADFVRTPLHDHCPGVVVHGAVFNAIVTRHFWRPTPRWVILGSTLTLGILTALAAVGLPAIGGFVAAIALLAGYLLINGVVFFDYFGLLIGVAAPVLSIGLVWTACALYRIIVETRERERIKARFQTYVDPMLVTYVLEHPEHVSLRGEVKELSVVFTDLANFTALSEKLGEKSVSLLNEYLGFMVPIIRRHRGYVNKFLGDGIMCFYGAPAESDTHAQDAVRTVLEMRGAMDVFNQKMAASDYPALTVRAGVSTGKMVVGDAGAIDASDYTVLGDAVNFGSRLEGANKYLGTEILVSGRTAAIANDEFLFCPVGRVRVAGKTEGVDVFEVMGLLKSATALQRQVVALWTSIISAFAEQRFDVCFEAIDEIERLTGPSKLTSLYQEISRRQVSNHTNDWDGTISLSDK
jgi:class 3 adenylate cyclase/CHASE2 domain-containing sensor protein